MLSTQAASGPKNQVDAWVRLNKDPDGVKKELDRLAEAKAEADKSSTALAARVKELDDRDAAVLRKEQAVGAKLQVLDKREADLADSESEHASRMSELGDKTDQLTKREQAVTTREAECSRREGIIADRVNRAREVIAQI